MKSWRGLVRTVPATPTCGRIASRYQRGAAGLPAQRRSTGRDPRRTWDKMTHSPTLVSLLRQVRSDEARVASLAQEYRNLALFLPSARAPRIFTQRDRRSDALARITHRAAAAGSPGQSAPSGRGWMSAKPKAPWPTSAAGAGRRALEALAGPRQALARRRAVGRRAGRTRARSRSRAHPRPTATASCGPSPAAAPLTLLSSAPASLCTTGAERGSRPCASSSPALPRTCPSLRGAVRAGGLYGTHARIVMDIDPRTSPTEVASLYAKWRAALALMLESAPIQTVTGQ